MRAFFIAFLLKTHPGGWHKKALHHGGQEHPLERDDYIAKYGELWGNYMFNNDISNADQYVKVLKRLIVCLQGLQFREGFALLEHAKNELERWQRYTEITYPPVVEEYDWQHGTHL